VHKFYKGWEQNGRTGVIGLHGTKGEAVRGHRSWDDIRKKGLQIGAHNSNGHGIYHTKIAGMLRHSTTLCKSCAAKSLDVCAKDCHNWSRYDLLTYSVDDRTCRFVISLLARTSIPYSNLFQRNLDAWLLSQPEDTIPLWMVEIDRKDFTLMQVKADDPEHRYRVTRRVLRQMEKKYREEICSCDGCAPDRPQHQVPKKAASTIHLNTDGTSVVA